ncbi:SusC/RagA family TonB-linked outer membrane protein [Echinicola pacifica]|uniref:SusC/RagA family TonB-linked outer membrane protein n=1 Tax=Echinicola pacifica TaxID=346377 RepID=A0A918UIJ5_9BACT|nr:TonB-dependent receptor [Echinicola pacifica]GGZ14511.1 SusC/RagA family TonB-linked outer membrane protein [Echinicola pacifica]
MRKIYTVFKVTVMCLALLAGHRIYAQAPSVSGTVTDTDSGDPLPFVNVLIKGTTKGTTTDFDGKYTINANSSEDILVFSFIGYNPKSVVVGNQSIINVSLESDTKQLDEVVVVGYGTQRKADLTGSVGSVDRDDFNVGQVTNPEQLIAGKVAGVQVTPNGGAPGSGGRIRIRGGASLNASNDPLIVIDGVPLDNSKTSGTANPLNFLNPNDIETFDILKDASATAIYGSRASNGVVLITTRKGKEGQAMKVNVSSLMSVSSVTKKVDMLNADQFKEIVDAQAIPAQAALIGTDATDWQSEIYQTALSYDNNVSISGAHKALPYRLSVGYLNQDGVLKTDNLQRTSGSLSLNPNLFQDKLHVNFNVKGVITKSRFANQDAIGAAAAFDPTQPVYDTEGIGGYWEWLNTDGTPQTLAPRNPMGLIMAKDDRGEVKRSIGNLQLDYELPFLEGLKANLNLGYDVSSSNGRTIIDANSASGYYEGGSVAPYEQSKRNLLADFYLNYVKEYKDSRLSLLVGYSAQDFLTRNPTFARLNIEGDTLAAAGVVSRPQYRLISYFGRANYTLKDKYLFTATIRADGSSRFAPDNRWGVFPSLAAAWRISEEDFLKANDFLTDLKLRLGYGVTGQQDIGSYFPYLPRYITSDNATRYSLGVTYYNTLRPEGYDENIKWEETTTYNVGIDYEFLDGKLYGTFDYYYKKTDDLLAVIPVPAGTNLTNQLFTNVGSIENQGLEIGLTFNVIKTTDFNWDIGGNYTNSRNTITSLSNVEEDGVGILVGGISGGTGNTIQVHTVGYQPNSFYVYEQVYGENGVPIEGVYVDQNEDGIINEQDRVRNGFPDARHYFGFNSSMRYKNWNFGFVLRGNAGNKAYNNVSSSKAAYQGLKFPGYLNNLPSDILTTNFQNYQLRSDYYIQDASFVRMENISVGYDFGNLFDSKIRLSASATVQNVFVITNYEGVSPEIAPGTDDATGGGIDNNFYPLPRIFSFGLNFGF